MKTHMLVTNLEEGIKTTPTLTLTRGNCLRVTFLQETLTLTHSNAFELEKHFSSDANGMAMLKGCVQHFQMQCHGPCILERRRGGAEHS